MDAHPVLHACDSQLTVHCNTVPSWNVYVYLPLDVPFEVPLEDAQHQPHPATFSSCLLQRGPKCAGALAQRLLERGLTSPLPEVLILRGGMTHFLKAYHDQPDLVENYDASVWEE